VVSPTRLPRASTLTEALLAPPDGAVSPVDLAALRTRLEQALGQRWGGSKVERVRVDAFFIRRGLLTPGELPIDRPFRWSPATARRTLGLASARHCLTRHCTPAEAARQAVELAVCSAADGRADSLGQWLAGLGVGARAVVCSEAITWTTQLLSALEWRRFESPLVGGPDRWWDCPSAPGLALRGRAEVRVPTSGGAPALFSMLSGRPRPTSRAELGLAALVDVLRRPLAVPPVRVVGWWPQCGRTLVLSVDVEALDRSAQAVTDALAATMSVQGGTRAAA
jgi:hypothetical protein